MMQVSLIIVNYNGSQHLPDLLQSIKDLDYPRDKLEVIFFDNGSTDDSLQVLRQKYPQARVIAYEKNLGFAAPHRIAAQKAKGEVLAFLNNDMRVHPEWISAALNCLDFDQGIVCVSSKILTWDGKYIDFCSGSLQYLGYAEQYQNNFLHDQEAILFPCGGAMFIHREVFLEAGCFDDDYFAVFEDVDLGWRLWMMGYQVVMSQKSISYHKGHATLDTKNTVQKRYLMHKNALITIIKNYEEENLKKILPVALNLALKRALLFLGVNKKQFYFWENHSGNIALNNDSIEGLLHLVVLDDVMEDFENIQQKRAAIQHKRMRRDDEILPYFKDPLRNIMGFKEYFWQEASLIGHFHLHEIFGCSQQYRNDLKHALGLASQDLAKMRKEMDRIMLQEPRVQFPKSSRLSSVWSRFQSKKQELGLFNTVLYAIKYCMHVFRKNN